MSRCRDGDREAWRELVGKYEALVHSIPSREGLSASDAADITQATFGQLLRQLEFIRQPESLGGWLSTVARRLTWQTRSRRNDELPIGLAPSLQEVTDEEIDHIASQQWVHQAVVSLPEPYRTIVSALFLEPFPPTYEELAARIGRPVGSIGPLRARSLARLRTVLEDQHDD